jgi:hypothetical protein
MLEKASVAAEVASPRATKIFRKIFDDHSA